ncbi:MAG: hypothetical protein AAF519_19715, partial [Bacteroidota bacterium]
MFRQIKISTKITGLVIAVVVISLLAVGYISYNMNKRDVRERFNNNLLINAQQRASKLDHYYSQIKGSLKFLSTNQILVEGTVTTAFSSETAVDLDSTSEGQEAAADIITFESPAPTGLSYDVPGFINTVKQAFGYDDIFITETNGVIKFSTNASIGEGSNFKDPDGKTISEIQKGT